MFGLRFSRFLSILTQTDAIASSSNFFFRLAIRKYYVWNYMGRDLSFIISIVLGSENLKTTILLAMYDRSKEN